MARESAADKSALDEFALDEFAAAPPMAFAAAGAVSGASTVSFAIPGATSVAPDNADRMVTVALLEFPATLAWAAAPAISGYAYLRAESANASDFPFLPGATHVYVDGAYVADAAMPAVAPGGTFKTDLGVDESITVERKLVRKFDETTGSFTKRSKTTWEYERQEARSDAPPPRPRPDFARRADRGQAARARVLEGHRDAPKARRRHLRVDLAPRAGRRDEDPARVQRRLPEGRDGDGPRVKPRRDILIRRSAGRTTPGG
jgi:hypothetical protein